MTNYLLIITFSLLFPLFNLGQLSIDYDCQLEVSEIILNYKKFEIEKFEIKYKQQFNKQRPWKDQFKYHFINDSILEHKYKTNKSLYKFEDGKYISIIDPRDSLWYENYKKDKIFTSNDSSGFRTNSTFSVNKLDTVLIAEYSIKEEGKTKTEISKYLSDSIWYIQKIISTHLSDSSKRVQSSVYRDNKWFMFFDYVEVKTQSGNENIIMISTTQYAGGFENSEKIISETILTRRTIYYYDEHGLIEKVEIIEIDNSSKDITTLTPIKKK